MSNVFGTTINTPSMNPHDRDVMIRTLAAEAGGEPPAGQAAVAHVIMNRVSAGGYGDGITGVIQKPGEFSTWNGVTGFARGKEASKLVTAPISQIPNYNQIGNLVDQVYSGQIPDMTNGATHYYAPQSMAGGKPPPWAGALAAQNQVKVGNQIFVGASQGPGRAPVTNLWNQRPSGIPGPDPTIAAAPGTTLNSVAGNPYASG